LLDVVLGKELPVVLGEAFGAVNEGDVVKAVDPKAKGIEGGFAEDDVFGVMEGGGVPDAGVGAR
jgi:hypothetical protein